MKNIRLLLMIIMSLVVLLPSSSFFLPTYLTQLIIDKQHNKKQLIYAIKQGNIAALNFSAEQEVIGSNNWLTLMAELASSQSEAAYNLANWYVKAFEQTDNPEKKHVMQNKAKMWLKQSMRIQPDKAKKKAQLLLAQLYFNQNDLLTAQTLVQTLNKNVSEPLKDEHVDTFSIERLL